MATVRKQGWCFTLNNYSDLEHDSICAVFQGDLVRYGVVGKEVGENQTPHLQGYVYFKTLKSMRQVKAILGTDRVHLEHARGTPTQAADYCKKDGNFFEHGVVPALNRGAGGEAIAEKWEAAKVAAQEGRIEDIPSDLFIQYYSTFRRIEKDFMRPPEDLDGVCGVWIHGKSGIGKSRYARYHYPDFYDKPLNKWWDGYQQQENVILDDIDPNYHMLAHYLKRWMDRYSFTCEVKGGAMSIRPKRIVVTSQYSIEECFPEPAAAEAIRRRCQVIYLPFPWVPPAITVPNNLFNPAPPAEADGTDDDDDIDTVDLDNQLEAWLNDI